MGDVVPLNSTDYTIFGLGFEEGNKSCFKRYLLEQFKKKLPGIEISNTVPDQSCIAIINLDKQSLPILEKTIPTDDSYVVLILHDLTRSTIPYLKIADHVVYINEVQKFVCEGVLDLNYPSSVLPYPFGEELPKGRSENCFVYMEGDGFLLDDSYYENRIQQALQWHHDENIKRYCFVFEVNSSAKQRFQEFKVKMSATDSRFRMYDSKEMTVEEIYALLNESFCGQLFKNEITLEQYLDALENSQSAILHDVLSASPILAVMRAVNIETSPSIEKTFYNYNFKKTGAWSDWHNLINHLLKEDVHEVRLAKTKAISTIEVDSLSDLNILYGKPLVNDYVFSICFRNQEEKIIRCLDSIKNQAGNKDFGIVMVSDKSSDNSVKKILDYIQDCGIDICLVDNQERKYASRNFYNVIHSLVSNDESVIMEVDGDDFLSGNDVLTTLDSYYSKGAWKTNGSYKMYPEGQLFANDKGVEFNHQNYDVSNPWSLRCTSWLHLRTAKRFLLQQVELKYFLERKSKKWLTDRHDSAIQPRVIELAGEKAVFVKEILYCYDVSGENHDHSGDSIDKLIFEDYKKTDKLYYPSSLSYM